jgi:5-methylcytosine-specific restriction endonuclease McrBC regulatory subunit McrC
MQLNDLEQEDEEFRNFLKEVNYLFEIFIYNLLSNR